MINRIAELAEENAELKKYIERMDKPEIQVIDAEILTLKEENAKLKAELQKFKDMAKKGLDEFKDVGGCWGCGLQLQLNQDLEAYKQSEQEATKIIAELKAYKDVNEDFKTAWAELKAENERLKEEIKVLQYNIAEYSNNNIDTAVTLFAKDKAKLEKENALLKAYKDKYYQQTLDDEIKLNELYQTLQEIKAIVRKNINYQDTDSTTRAMTKILDLITKAEEEW